jgi:hypothetical protein
MDHPTFAHGGLDVSSVPITSDHGNLLAASSGPALQSRMRRALPGRVQEENLLLRLQFHITSDSRFNEYMNMGLTTLNANGSSIVENIINNHQAELQSSNPNHSDT